MFSPVHCRNIIEMLLNWAENILDCWSISWTSGNSSLTVNVAISIIIEMLLGSKTFLDMTYIYIYFFLKLYTDPYSYFFLRGAKQQAYVVTFSLPVIFVVRIRAGPGSGSAHRVEQRRATCFFSSDHICLPRRNVTIILPSKTVSWRFGRWKMSSNDRWLFFSVTCPGPVCDIGSQRAPSIILRTEPGRAKYCRSGCVWAGRESVWISAVSSD
jgi:hypothetical protein